MKSRVYVSWDEKNEVARFAASGTWTKDDSIEASQKLDKVKKEHPSCDYLLVDGTEAKFVKGTEARKILSDGVSVFKYHAIFGVNPSARMVIKVINKLGKSRSKVEYFFFKEEEEALAWLNKKRDKE